MQLSRKPTASHHAAHPPPYSVREKLPDEVKAHDASVPISDAPPGLAIPRDERNDRIRR